MDREKRGEFKSRIGFIFVSAGCAIGIGNVWKFPYMTGENGGELAALADVAVKVPETETYKIQELHLPVYHCWCLMLEQRFFGDPA